MKHENFEKLKGKVEEKTFYNNYKDFSKLSKFLSYVGNLFSILFAYFFLIDIATSALISPTSNTLFFISIGVVLVLVMVELSKRFIFDKFSQSFIKDKFRLKSGEVKILSAISLGLIAVSFYFSLNGAQQYADKDIEIKETVENNISNYKDSLTNIYNIKIEKIEKMNDGFYSTNNQYDSLIRLYDSKYMELGTNSWKERQEKDRIKSIITEKKKDKESNLSIIDKNENKIKVLKKELSNEILSYGSKLNNKTNVQIEENKDNPFIFITFSTIIELIILFGVYFINYFDIRSLSEYQEKIKKDPRYRTFDLWNKIISAVYTEETRIGETLPFKTQMMKMFKASSIDISSKDVDEALRMFTHLDILKKKGNKKAVNMNEDDAREKIKKHFRID